METQIVTAEGNHLNLSEQEQTFVYMHEIVGLNAKRAAEVAGVSQPYALLKKPHIITALDQARASVRSRVNFTREDVVAGMKEAIDQAKVMADPMAQIAGWREIGKLLGYDKTPNINIHMTGTVDQMAKQIKGLSTEELQQMAGSNVLDGDFYSVDRNGAD